MLELLSVLMCGGGAPPAPIATVSAKAKSPEEKATTKAKKRTTRRARGMRQFRVGGPTGLNIG